MAISEQDKKRIVTLDVLAEPQSYVDIDDMPEGLDVWRYVTIPHAQILTCFSAPPLLLTAPGPNRFIQVISSFWAMDSIATYSPVIGPLVRYAGSGPLILAADAAMWGATALWMQTVTPAPTQFAAAELNRGIEFSVGGSNPTGGNVANKLKLRLLYRVWEVNM